MIRFTGLIFRTGFKPETENRFNMTQKFIDSEVLRLSDPYVPFRTGMLKKSGISGTVIGSGIVEYTAPYAKPNYYTNAGKGKEGMNKTSGTKGLRGAFWFDRMKADHKDEILKKAKEKF